VLKQLYQGKEIRRGTEIVKGSEIELVLGQGLSNERTNVPNILGNTKLEAQETLIKYLLNFGVIIYDNSVVTSADTVKAFIYQQRPAARADAMLQLGSGIDVWMTVDEAKKPNSSNE
jgi:beta-lactam-binding protein with PASTA domain